MSGDLTIASPFIYGFDSLGPEQGGGGYLNVDGGTLSVGGLVSAGGSIFAEDGGAIEAAALTLGDESELGLTDSSSSITVGDAAAGVAGEIIIGSGITVDVPKQTQAQLTLGSTTAIISAPTVVNDGTISMSGARLNQVLSLDSYTTNFVNNGAIDISNGTLYFTHGFTNNGQINIGSDASLWAEGLGISTGAINFTGTGNSLLLSSDSLDTSNTLGPVVNGFNPTDVLDFMGTSVTGTSLTSQSPTSSTLNLLDGAQVVAHIDLGRNYSGVSFTVSPISGGTQIQIATSVSPPIFDQTWNLLGVADFNGDGFSDLAWEQQSSNTVELQFAYGNSTLGGGVIANSPFDSSWSAVATGDFNGDGLSDLVYQQASSGLSEIALLDGLSVIGGGAIQNNPFGTGWKVAGVGDFTGSGTDDLVWQNQSTGLVEIELINARGGSVSNAGGGAIANNPFGSDWKIVTTGDFNDNEIDGLVWQNQSTGLVELQYLDGNMAIGGGAIANSPFGAGWNIVGAGDFLGNGFSDLVYQRQSDGLVEIQYLNGNTATGGGAITNSPFGPGWQVVGVGDFTGSGKADLVYRNTSSGTTEVQFLNGITPVGGGIIAAG